MKKLANCNRCKLRSACIAPCDALLDRLHREEKRGSTHKGEWPIGTPDYILEQFVSILPEPYLTRMEKVILTLELAKWDRVAIAKLFGIKRDSVRKYIYSARKKILRKS